MGCGHYMMSPDQLARLRAPVDAETSLITWRSWPPAAWLGTAKAKDRIVQFFHDSRPVVDWLDEHVGNPEA